MGKSGHFRLTYRFRDPSSRGHRFQFRIKIERDTGYAYYGGYSRTATRARALSASALGSGSDHGPQEGISR